jgi:pSer/pThr/pTyr-binding forkhead associated (FHA) protein
MTAKLVVTDGPAAGREIDLDQEVVIGREGVSFTLDDSELSRRHAVVRRAAGGYEVEDLGSLNGTYVNGQKIVAATSLAGGDTLKLGQTVVRLEAERAGATVASRVPAAAGAAAMTGSAATNGPAPDTAPTSAFGTFAAPIGTGRRRGIASRQLGPMIASWGAVVATAAALVVYFSQHHA